MTQAGEKGGVRRENGEKKKRKWSRKYAHTRDPTVSPAAERRKIKRNHSDKHEAKSTATRSRPAHGAPQ